MRPLDLIFIFAVILLFYFKESECKEKRAKEYPLVIPGPKYSNPGNIHDRERDLEAKAYNKWITVPPPPVTYKTKAPKTESGGPAGPDGRLAQGLFRPSILGEKWNNRFKAKWHPAWMDYCDPYHCNDYHHPACGLNRKSMKFKWFQSGCHITLNNFCSKYKGALKYDTVATRFCVKNVMHLRSGCSLPCDEDDYNPVCGNSLVDNHLVLFKNPCWMAKANCNSTTLDEYDPVDISICKFSFAFRQIKLL